MSGRPRVPSGAEPLSCDGPLQRVTILLVDHEILKAVTEGRIQVEPSDGIHSRIQPASLDVRLGHRFACLARARHATIDPKVDTSQYWRTDEVAEDDYYVVHPGELILAGTLERVGLPQDIVARVEGKSSLGRLGILVHATAGFIDPGWPLASITLEIVNALGVPIKLYPGMPIAQLAFEQTATTAQAYSGKYVGQDAPVPSRYHQNWSGTRWM